MRAAFCALPLREQAERVGRPARRANSTILTRWVVNPGQAATSVPSQPPTGAPAHAERIVVQRPRPPPGASS